MVEKWFFRIFKMILIKFSKNLIIFQIRNYNLFQNFFKSYPTVLIQTVFSQLFSFRSYSHYRECFVLRRNVSVVWMYFYVLLSETPLKDLKSQKLPSKFKKHDNTSLKLSFYPWIHQMTNSLNELFWYIYLGW